MKALHKPQGNGILTTTSAVESAARPFAPRALPALNPNQPNHKSDAPSTTNGILCGTTLLFSMPFLLPINIASTRPETPELICTTLPPAKSIEPI